jgi:hypothetical protein
VSDQTALPRELEEAFRFRHAEITDRWDEGPRTYAHLDSPTGKLFARTSSDPHDIETIQHEVTVRALVGTEGALRAPEVLAAGPNWILETGMTSNDMHGPDAVETVIAAAQRLQTLELPVKDDHSNQSGGGAFRRRLKLLGSGIRIRDLIAARRILTEEVRKPVTSHGDFHVGNVFYKDGALWVVDWEMVDKRPPGYDLMQFWASIERSEDRDLLFEKSVDVIGEDQLRTIANKVGATHEFNRDVRGGRRLLELLPVVRAAAF